MTRGAGAGEPAERWSSRDLRQPAPVAPAVAATIFGSRLSLAERFAALLADTGISHGLIGPREVPRLWDRHLLNCAVVQGAFPIGSRMIDVGSGAGLPGLAVAIVRSDLEVHLIEPMLRRTDWLARTSVELGLDNVTVHRGRAQEFHGVLDAPYVTARAVARIDTLAKWTFPLLRGSGVLVALKGSSAQLELEQQRTTLAALGMVDAAIRRWGAGVLDPPTRTLELTVAMPRRGAGARSGPRRGRPRA